MAVPTFEKLIQMYRKVPIDPDRIVSAFDPGETTGWCVFHGMHMHQAGELKTGTLDYYEQETRKFLTNVRPAVLVIEDYRVYSWKTEQHANQRLLVPEMLGMTAAICASLDPRIPIRRQTANQAKTWMTDDKLKQWGLWQKGQRHARDAIRHALYYILFNEEKDLNAKSK